MTAHPLANSARALPAMGGDLPRLTSLRAFAAGAVFLYHAARYTPWAPFREIALGGFAGVGFFFVLSGFVLTWSTGPSVTSRQFWRRRVARIYPSHVVMALVALLAPVVAYPPTPTAAAANLALVQAWFVDWAVIFGLNGVSWSLSCEAFFYLLTPFMLRALRPRPTALVVAVVGSWWAFASVILLAASRSGTSDITAYVNPATRSGEFALGCLLAILVQRGWRPRVPLLAATALVVLLWPVVGVAALPQSAATALLALPFAALVLAAALADLQGRPGRLRSRTLVYLGQVSFAFYLVHELVLLNLTPRLGTAWSRPIGYVLLAVLGLVALAAAMALHHGVEKPMQVLIRGRRPSAPVLSDGA
jgi:peptidoglycan/LPS O-acetylase OafA/YrhL